MADVLQALRGFRQYLVEENKRLIDFENQKNINLAAAEIATRFSNLGDTASESDIRKMTFNTIRDAAVAGVLPQVQGMISSFSQSALTEQEGQKIEDYTVGYSGDQSLRGMGAQAPGMLGSKEQYEDSQKLQTTYQGYNKQTGAEENYIRIYNENTGDLMKEIKTADGLSWGEQKQRHEELKKLDFQYSKSSFDYQQPKQVGWLQNGGGVFRIGSQLVTSDPNTGQIRMPYNEALHGKYSNSPNALLTGDKTNQTILNKQWKETIDFADSRSKTLLQSYFKDNDIFKDNVDSDGKFTKGASATDVLKTIMSQKNWSEIYETLSTEAKNEIEGISATERLASAARDEYLKANQRIAQDQLFTSVGLTSQIYNDWDNHMQFELDTDARLAEGVRRFYQTNYLFTGRDASKFTSNWWKRLKQQDKIKVIKYFNENNWKLNPETKKKK